MTTRHPSPDPRPVLGVDGYPAQCEHEYDGVRVWDVDELEPVAEGHGLRAFEALGRHTGDDASMVAAREGWARFVDRCDHDACHEAPGDCDGSCDCAGRLPPCGDEWSWYVSAAVRSPGAVAVTWAEVVR